MCCHCYSPSSNHDKIVIFFIINNKWFGNLQGPARESRQHLMDIPSYDQSLYCYRTMKILCYYKLRSHIKEYTKFVFHVRIRRRARFKLGVIV